MTHRERAAEAVASLTLDELLDQLRGDLPLIRGLWDMLIDYNGDVFVSGDNPARGIPPLLFTDGPRGVVAEGSTCFPVGMARGATWDPELEERVGQAIGVEARSHGANFVASVCINVLRHPAWGRAQETYGEDPVHLGVMGAAQVRGLQKHVMACVKHFACNSIENSRFWVDVRIPERALREVYLPAFRRCVEAGAASIMSAYNRLNGEWCGSDRRLLTEILREEWGFEGFVMSDFVLGAHRPSDVAAGLDVEMPIPIHYRHRLRWAVRRGRIKREVLEVAARRVVATKLRFAEVGSPERYGPESIACEDHVALARETATRAMVLLRNEGDVLPLDPAGSLAVIGKLAALEVTGDRGSSRVRAPYVVTPLQGLSEAAGDLRYHDGLAIKAAATLASQQDAAVVVVGFTARDEGENMPFQGGGGDRDSLRLRPHDEALILAVCAANPRTVVVLVAGGAVLTESWRQRAPAILMAWYAGMEGGHALADLVFGRANPSGKLPCVFARSPVHLPYFDARAHRVQYGLLHGHRLLQSEGHEPAFGFGFGLSYTRFSLREPRVEPAHAKPGDTVTVSVSVIVSNTGAREGAEVVQLYAGRDGSAVERAPRELKAFARVSLTPGEERRVSLELPVSALAHWAEGWVVERGQWRLEVGTSSDPADLRALSLTVD